MLSKILGSSTVNNLFIFGYCLLAIGLPFNKIVLSLGTMFLFLLFLLELKPKKDFKRIKTNSALVILLLLLLVHSLSLIWSSDTAYFLKDFNAKLPLYALPIVLVTHPIRSVKQLSFILYSFLTSLTFISLYNFIHFYYLNYQIDLDLREMSLFGSHIRLGLMIIFAIVCCVYLLWTNALRQKWLIILTMIWLLFYTYSAAVFNAYFALIFLLIICLYWILFKTYSRKKAIILSGILSVFIILSGLSVYLFVLKPPPPIDISKMDKFSKRGKAYIHVPASKYYINGHHVYSYICEEELHYGWQEISTVSLYDTNKLGYQHYYTLLQYMSSMGLRKDSDGLKKLKPLDIQRILAGKIDFVDQKSGFFSRLENLRNEFYDDDPNGKTLKQRREFIKTGWHIFSLHPIIGVGAGDLQQAFDKQYKIDRTRLHPQNRLRAHNQFLTYFISFGLIGGSIFLFLILQTFILFVRKSDWLSGLFIGLMFFSFLSEDTLETQMGVSFFALFFGIFVGMKSTIIDWHDHEN